MVLETLNNLTINKILKWFLIWTFWLSSVCSVVVVSIFKYWKSPLIFELGENYKFEAAECHVLTHYPDSIMLYNTETSHIYFRTLLDITECSYNDKYIIATQEGYLGEKSDSKDHIVTAPEQQSDTIVHWLVDKIQNVAYGPYSEDEFNNEWGARVIDLKFKSVY